MFSKRETLVKTTVGEEALVQRTRKMRAYNVLGVAILSALMGSTALAQEMGGAMGPGSNYGYEPEPTPTYSDRVSRGDGLGPLGDRSGPYARIDKSDGYCRQRPSYDPQSDTFTTPSGRRRPC
jgi:hypothetical protein